MIKPAVEGTLRALKSANKAGIKRIVVTSSMVAMLGDLRGDTAINQKSWTNTNAKNITAYLKSKTLAEKAAWEYTSKHNMELVTIHPGPVYGPTLSNNISGESMTTIKRVISGEMPRVLHASINMSDVRDVASIHVKALENSKAPGKRFIVASERAYSFIELAKELKSNGYEKVSSKAAPSFLIKLMANFNSEMKGMLPYVGKTYEADIKETKETFNWEPIKFNKMVTDTAKSVESIINS